MLELEELRLATLALQPEIDNLDQAMGLEQLRSAAAQLEAETASEGFWDDLEKSQKVLQKAKQTQGKIDALTGLRSQYEDLLTLIDLAQEEKDESVYPEAKEEYDSLAAKVEEMRLSTLLTGEYDGNNAILTFHAGAGGTEAQDWAEMLYRMYTRFAARHGFNVKVLDYLDGDEAGLKSASILVEGHNAYGMLRSENGVHRLVRISPFDASGRRHTSFSSLEVMPELDDSITVEIHPDDIEMEVYRSSGAGGQKVNKASW